MAEATSVTGNRQVQRQGGESTSCKWGKRLLIITGLALLALSIVWGVKLDFAKTGIITNSLNLDYGLAVAMGVVGVVAIILAPCCQRSCGRRDNGPRPDFSTARRRHSAPNSSSGERMHAAAAVATSSSSSARGDGERGNAGGSSRTVGGMAPAGALQVPRAQVPQQPLRVAPAAPARRHSDEDVGVSRSRRGQQLVDPRWESEKDSLGGGRPGMGTGMYIVSLGPDGQREYP